MGFVRRRSGSDCKRFSGCVRAVTPLKIRWGIPDRGHGDEDETNHQQAGEAYGKDHLTVGQGFLHHIPARLDSALSVSGNVDGDTDQGFRGLWSTKAISLSKHLISFSIVLPAANQYSV